MWEAFSVEKVRAAVARVLACQASGNGFRSSQGGELFEIDMGSHFNPTGDGYHQMLWDV